MSLAPDNTTIGFIGTGVMGKSMASHLLKAGYRVFVFNRTKTKADELISLGATWQDTIAEVASKADVVITMVGSPRDVEEIYLGKGGILNHTKAGTYLIDMTTSSPSLAEKIYEKALKNGQHALDAPVSGGDIGARDANLVIMVGGDREAFKTVWPILSIMGKNILLQGKAGAGQHTKMCNQITVASNMIGVCEAMVYAKKVGLDPNQVIKSTGTGAAGSWSLNHLAPKMITHDFEPGFYVKHFIKDMIISLEAAKEVGMYAPGLELAHSLYQKLADMGEEYSGTQALFKLYDR